MTDPNCNPAQSPKPVVLNLTIPGPVCGCPLVIELATMTDRPDPQPGAGPELADVWLFNPAQLRELLDALVHAAIGAYGHALEKRANELEQQAAACEQPSATDSIH